MRPISLLYCLEPTTCAIQNVTYFCQCPGIRM